MPTSPIERKQLAAEPILYIRRQVAPDQLPSVLGECFGKLYHHGASAGLAIAGPPIARYIAMEGGRFTVDSAMPLAEPAPAAGELEAGFLQAGPAAVATHEGPYETLRETYGAIERWMAENGVRSGGAPWERYLTDPGQVADPADWRTEVVWPIAE